MSETKQREILKLTKEQALNILTEEDDEFANQFEIISNTPKNQNRWTTTYKLIVKRNDGKFFRSDYRKGSTEYQDEGPWEYDQPEFIEVFPIEKVVTIYE